jgi:hypothetical protein
LIGRQDGRALLALVKNDSISSDDVNALIAARGGLQRSQNGTVQAMLTTPESGLLVNSMTPEVLTALKAAKENEIEVYSSGELGFKRVTISSD